MTDVITNNINNMGKIISYEWQNWRFNVSEISSLNDAFWQFYEGSMVSGRNNSCSSWISNSCFLVLNSCFLVLNSWNNEVKCLLKYKLSWHEDSFPCQLHNDYETDTNTCTLFLTRPVMIMTASLHIKRVWQNLVCNIVLYYIKYYFLKCVWIFENL